MIRSGNKTTSTSTSSMSSFNIQQRVLPSSSYYSYLLFFQFRSSTWLGLGSILLLIAFSALFLYNNNINNSPFDQPFCDPDGTCHEAPDQGTPRTVYSTWNKEQFDGWWKFYEVLNEHAEVYANKRQAMYERGNTTALRSRPLILLGDSITESWSGTGMGIPKQRADVRILIIILPFVSYNSYCSFHSAMILVELTSFLFVSSFFLSGCITCIERGIIRLGRSGSYRTGHFW